MDTTEHNVETLFQQLGLAGDSRSFLSTFS